MHPVFRAVDRTWLALLFVDKIRQQFYAAINFLLTQKLVIVFLIQGYDALIVFIVFSQIAPAVECLSFFFLVC